MKTLLVTNSRFLILLRRYLNIKWVNKVKLDAIFYYYQFLFPSLKASLYKKIMIIQFVRITLIRYIK
jgi:uncharacterized protein VirK/YbjX